MEDAADHDHGDGDGDGHEHGHDDHGHGGGPDGERTTAPMSEFGGREAGIGALVALVGLVVAFVVPLLAV